MLQTNDISFAYPGLSFYFPDITCESKEALVVSGSSGKGKTTLLHLLAGILKPTKGSIYINGEDITSLSTAKLDAFRGRNIGLITQKPHLIYSLSIVDNLLLPGYMGSKKIGKERIVALLDQLNILDQMHKRPHQLSLGQLQRVCIARAFLHDPALVLADEPTSSLDDDHCLLVCKLIQKYMTSGNAAVVIVTHDQRVRTQFSKSITLT
ncbi:MAG: ATP-binding cassette domain-containing protein [Chitinophagaceae bacterium]